MWYQSTKLNLHYIVPHGAHNNLKLSVINLNYCQKISYLKFTSVGKTFDKEMEHEVQQTKLWHVHLLELLSSLVSACLVAKAEVDKGAFQFPIAELTQTTESAVTNNSKQFCNHG